MVEEIMDQADQSLSAKVSKDGRFLVIVKNGTVSILPANLVRYLLDVPYTRKDGTHVSSRDIFDMKERAQDAYKAKVRKSAG